MSRKLTITRNGTMTAWEWDDNDPLGKIRRVQPTVLEMMRCWRRILLWRTLRQWG